MILIGGLTTIFYILMPLFLYLGELFRWNNIKKLPLDKRWYFTDEGITVDEIYAKRKFTWEQVTRVANRRTSDIWFSSNNLIIGCLPKRVLNQEQLKQLEQILNKKLDSQILKHYRIQEKK